MSNLPPPRFRRPSRLRTLVAGALAMFALTQAQALTLGTQGCPMAHCDSRMSDMVNDTAPAVASLVRLDRTAPPARGGLGCVSNSRLVACTGGGDPAVTSNLVVYDADGNRVWEDGGLLGTTAWKSAAILGDDDRLIAADQDTVLMADLKTGSIVWQTPKPDAASPISPVLAGAAQDMVFLASGAGSAMTAPRVSVFDVATGALLSSQVLFDPDTQLVYATYNTPAVQGNRAYVLASAMGREARGRLFALDICDSDVCGGRGTLSVAWTYDFRGPSGSSPLLVGSRVFFDGRTSSGGGTFMAIEDTGAAPSLLWQSTFSAKFAASAAQDPRGGFWVYPWQTGNLLRIHPGTGQLLQTVNVSALLGATARYYPVSAVSVSASPSGAVVLTFGARTAGKSTATPPYIVAADVSSAANGALLWQYKFSRSASLNVPTGQFPVVVGPTGARRVVLRGSTGSTAFVGEP